MIGSRKSHGHCLHAVLRQLQILEASGIVRSKKIGRARTCRIERTALRTSKKWIAWRRALGAALDPVISKARRIAAQEIAGAPLTRDD